MATVTRAIPGMMTRSAVLPALLAAVLAACGSRDEERASRPAAADPTAAPALAARVNTVAAADGACLPYEPDTVTVTGRLERRIFYGPPNYGENPETDEPQPGYYLVPDAPLCTRGMPDPQNDAKQGVELVQVVLDAEGYARWRPHLDRRVQATGTLFGQISGHHHAPLLLRAHDIRDASR
jgi:hypothetical protein